MSARPLVVFGGGALGGAVARLAASRGASVTVASRHPGEHVGWWRRVRVGGEASLGWLPAQADVVIAVGPGAGERAAETWGPAFAAWLARLRSLRPARVVLAGPAGLVGGGIEHFDRCARAVRQQGVAVVRLPALLATERGWAGELAAALRRGQAPRLSARLPGARALVVEDAARAVLAELAGHADVMLSGPAPVTAEEVIRALEVRYGASTRPRLFGTGVAREVRERLRAQEHLDDSWDDARYGPRTTLATWVERQPGPRRRRGESGA
ncbi:MAG: hypothetical protein EXR71_09175 [Myxococcales bacterium]|nr:hypothetical protein [Myxococcales bacterium]